MATRTGRALGSSVSAPEIGSSSARSKLKENDRARLERMLTRATSGQGAAGEPKRPPGGAPRTVRGRATATSQGGASPGAGGRRGTGAPAEAAARSLSQSIPRLAMEMGTPSPKAVNRRALDDDHPPRTEKAQQFVRKLLGQDGTGQGPMDWRLVQEMDAVDYLVQEDKSRKYALAQKQNMRSMLRNQQHEAKLAELRDREEKRRWGSKMQQDANRFWEEEQIRRRESQEAQHRFNQEQAAHIEEMRLRKQEEKQRELDIEQQMHERAALAKQIEVAREEERRRKHQAAAAQVMEDARQAAARRQEKRRDEAQRDVAMLRIQQETLERQEQERVEYFNNIRKRQDTQQAAHQANVALELQKKHQEADARTKRQMHERLQKDRNADEEKQQRLRQLAMDGHAEVERQLEEKTQKRARDREESLRLAQEFQREAKLAKDEEARKVQERREKEKENAKYLLAQMEQKSSIVPGRFGHEQMNQVEKSLNRERLERAKGDETLQMLFKSKQLQFGLAK